MDQYLVASLALVAFSAFVVGAYIWHSERRGKRSYSMEPTEAGNHLMEDDRRLTPEQRARRGF